MFRIRILTVLFLIVSLFSCSQKNETTHAQNNSSTTELDQTVQTEKVDDEVMEFLYVHARPHLNMRAGEDAKSEIVATIPDNTKVPVYKKGKTDIVSDINDIWYLVEYENKRGWVFGLFLSEFKRPDPVNTISENKFLINSELDKMSAGFFQIDMSENEIREISKLYDTYSIEFEWYEDEMESYPYLKLVNSNKEIIMHFYYHYKYIDWDSTKVAKNAKIYSIEVFSSQFKHTDGFNTGTTFKEIYETAGEGHYQMYECDVPSYIWFDKYPYLAMNPKEWYSKLYSEAEIEKIEESLDDYTKIPVKYFFKTTLESMVLTRYKGGC
jgi:hypothetical protein